MTEWLEETSRARLRATLIARFLAIVIIQTIGEPSDEPRDVQNSIRLARSAWARVPDVSNAKCTTRDGTEIAVKGRA